jgi:integrase/recombinase XerD
LACFSLGLVAAQPPVVFFSYLVREEDQGMLATAGAIETFLAALRSAQTPINTLKAYRLDLLRFARFVPDDLAAVTSAQIQAFLDGDGAISIATRRRRHASVSAFYRFLLRQDLIAANPMARIAVGTAPEREPRPLTDEAVQRILAAIPAAATRDRALFTVLYETGMRISEALGIHIDDLDLASDDEKVRVYGKGRRERTVLLTSAPESIRLLRRHLKVSGIRSGALFRGDRRYGGSNLPLEYSVAHYAWQKYCRKAGVTGTIHQLRHSRASQLIQAGVPLATVRKLLGHRNIQSTLRYAEVDQATIKRDLLTYQRQRGRRR